MIAAAAAAVVAVVDYMEKQHPLVFAVVKVHHKIVIADGALVENCTAVVVVVAAVVD